MEIMHLNIVAIFVCASNCISVGGESTVNESFKDCTASARKQEDVAAPGGMKSDIADDVVVKCLYQYPTAAHVKALTSNLMNILTKVFVRTRSYLVRRRKGALRFRVVNNANTSFFDHVFKNMTKEYSGYATNVSQPTIRSHQDPCEHQEDLKLKWKQLLDFSQEALRRATQHFFDNLDQEDIRLIKKLKFYLEKQSLRARKSQLKMVCRDFQLCYYDI